MRVARGSHAGRTAVARGASPAGRLPGLEQPESGLEKPSRLRLGRLSRLEKREKKIQRLISYAVPPRRPSVAGCASSVYGEGGSSPPVLDPPSSARWLASCRRRRMARCPAAAEGQALGCLEPLKFEAVSLPGLACAAKVEPQIAVWASRRSPPL